MEILINFIFYLVVCLLFTDLAFFIVRKFMAFANSLIHTKFNFDIAKVKVRSDL